MIDVTSLRNARARRRRPAELIRALLFVTATGAAATMLAACATGTPPASTGQADTPGEPGEWLVLFDGHSTEHWRGFRRDDFPADGWIVEDEALTPLTEGTVVDLITRERFHDFELELEWRVAPAGNSGIFVHVSEEHPEVWHTGPELQVLDDAGHPDGLVPETSAGSIYGLVAPEGKHLRNPDEYNHARIIARGSHVAHFLNGVQVLETDLASDTFRARVAGSTFSTLPDYARRFDGHVALQHASVSPRKAPVWFRNVRIRQLP